MDNEKILNQICYLYGIKKDTDLADKLGILRQTLYKWRKGAKMDLEAIAKAFPDLDLNVNITASGAEWFVTRKGDDTDVPSVTMPDREETISKRITVLTDRLTMLEEQIAVLRDLVSTKDTVIKMLTEKIKNLETRG